MAESNVYVLDYRHPVLDGHLDLGVSASVRAVPTVLGGYRHIKRVVSIVFLGFDAFKSSNIPSNIKYLCRQEDIGLEIFKTGQLFLHLVNPTLVVIITVIQLHYCHDRFLIISEIPSV